MRLTPAQIAEFEKRTVTEGDEIQLQNPVSEHFIRFISDNSQWGLDVVEQNSAQGRVLGVCGAGPSLADHLDVLGLCDDVWGVNSALPWLYGRAKVTHGFTTDQTQGMLSDWASFPPVTYLVASSVAPNLLEEILLRERDVLIFHNFVGVPGPNVRGKAKDSDDDLVLSFEDFLYSTQYPPTVRAGSGLNSVTRAIDVSEFMGYEHVHVLGCDSAWRDGEFHADGSPSVGGTVLEVLIGDRLWVTKPDLVMSAIALAQQSLVRPMTIHGDVLPNHLIGRVDEMVDALPTLIGQSGAELQV